MTFHIHTYGCQMNVRDSEAVAALLVDAGHSMADSEDDADIVIVNTCSVRGKAEDKAIGKLGLLCSSKREKPWRIVGVMGCMAERLKGTVFDIVKGLDFSVGSRSAARIPSVIAAIEAGASGGTWVGEDIAGHAFVPHGHLPGAISAFVTVLLGCSRRCSYCIVPDARGPEYSRPAREVLDEIAKLAASGVREVTLLGQSVLGYGRGREKVWEEDAPASSFTEPFPRLLEAVSRIDGIRRIRFTSGHPVGCTAELARAFRDIPSVCAHLHLPVQSGSDRILREMRRGYTVAKYLESIARLRDAVPDIALTTDVIVGYPGETEEDFEETRDLMRKARFDNAFVFKYSPRPGTPAAQLPDDVSAEEKDRRDKVLLADLDALGVGANTAYVGREVEVLVEGTSLRNEERLSGRTEQNKIVVFDKVPGVGRGDIASVMIERVGPQTLFGKLVKVEQQ